MAQLVVLDAEHIGQLIEADSIVSVSGVKTTAPAQKRFRLAPSPRHTFY